MPEEIGGQYDLWQLGGEGVAVRDGTAWAAWLSWNEMSGRGEMPGDMTFWRADDGSFRAVAPYNEGVWLFSSGSARGWIRSALRAFPAPEGTEPFSFQEFRRHWLENDGQNNPYCDYIAGRSRTLPMSERFELWPDGSWWLVDEACLEEYRALLSPITSEEEATVEEPEEPAPRPDSRPGLRHISYGDFSNGAHYNQGPAGRLRGRREAWDEYTRLVRIGFVVTAFEREPDYTWYAYLSPGSRVQLTARGGTPLHPDVHYYSYGELARLQDNRPSGRDVPDRMGEFLTIYETQRDAGSIGTTDYFALHGDGSWWCIYGWNMPEIMLMPPMPESMACHSCGEEMEYGDLRYCSLDGFYYCEDCFNEHFVICEECGGLTSSEDANYVDDNAICESCLRRNYSTCVWCENYARTEDCVTDSAGDTYCENCAEGHLHFCSYCNEYHNRDYECDENYSEHGERVDELPGVNDLDDPIRIGVEFEVEFPGGRNSRVIDNAPRYLGVKTDGSLHHNGLEFVSPPMTPKQSDMVIRETMEHLTAHGGEFMHTCGLHVHISHPKIRKTWKATRRIFALFSLLEGFVQDYYQGRERCASSYCAPIASRIATELAGPRFTGNDLLWSTKLRKQMFLKVLGTNPYELRHLGGRYLGVNRQALSDHGTLEFRYLGGTTVSRKRLQSWVQFLVEAVRFCVESSDDVFLNWCIWTSGQKDVVHVVRGIMPNEWEVPSRLWTRDCPVEYLSAAAA